MVVGDDGGPHPDLYTVPNGYPTGKSRFHQNVGANVYIGSDSYSSPAVETHTPSRDPGCKARKRLKKAVLHSRKNGFYGQLIHVSPIERLGITYFDFRVSALPSAIGGALLGNVTAERTDDC